MYLLSPTRHTLRMSAWFAVRRGEGKKCYERKGRIRKDEKMTEGILDSLNGTLFHFFFAFFRKHFRACIFHSFFAFHFVELTFPWYSSKGSETKRLKQKRREIRNEYIHFQQSEHFPPRCRWVPSVWRPFPQNWNISQHFRCHSNRNCNLHSIFGRKWMRQEKERRGEGNCHRDNFIFCPIRARHAQIAEQRRKVERKRKTKWRETKKYFYIIAEGELGREKARSIFTFEIRETFRRGNLFDYAIVSAIHLLLNGLSIVFLGARGEERSDTPFPPAFLIFIGK